MKRITLDNGVVAWGMSSSKYVQEAVSNVEKRLKEKNLHLPKRATTPFATGYVPEADVSTLLDPSEANYFQSLIGILRWMVELGRVDQATIDDFRRSGLLHIMAVSGSNVVLLCSMWSFVFLLLAVSRSARHVSATPAKA